MAWQTHSASEHARFAWYLPAAMREDATDSELGREIAAGGSSGREAERLLCLRFAPRIRLYGLKHLRDAERAQDLVQMVLLAVLQATRDARVQDIERLDRFVLGTCRNTVSRMREIEVRSVPASDELLDSIGIAPVESIGAGALVSCLDALDERAQQIVWLSFHEEHSADEIANMLAMTAGNIRVARHRALASLRRCLDAKSPRELRA